MSQLHDRIRRHYRSLDEAQEEISFEELADRTHHETTIELRPFSRSRLPLIAIGVLVALPFLVAFLGVLTTRPVESTPADSVVPPTTTAVSPPSTMNGERAADRATSATIVPGYEPFGPVSVTHAGGASEFIPLGMEQVNRSFAGSPDGPGVIGGMVKTDEGYLALGFGPNLEPAFATSPDGFVWEILDIGIDPAEARLFEAGGWFWIKGLDSMFRSNDGRNWDLILSTAYLPQEWVEFGEHLVALEWDYTVSEGTQSLWSVHIETGEVERRRVPLEKPGALRSWLGVINGKLNVIYSPSFVQIGEPEPQDPTVMQRVVTANLEVWEEVDLPRLVDDGTETFWLRGSPDNGYLAVIQKHRGQLGRTDYGYFSSDGEEWQPFELPRPSVNYQPFANLFDEPVPARINGEQALLWLRLPSFEPTTAPEMFVTPDGESWQRVLLDNPRQPEEASLTPPIAYESLFVIGDTVFYYQRTGAWLSAWKIEFDR